MSKLCRLSVSKSFVEVFVKLLSIKLVIFGFEMDFRGVHLLSGIHIDY